MSNSSTEFLQQQQKLFPYLNACPEVAWHDQKLSIFYQHLRTKYSKIDARGGGNKELCQKWKWTFPKKSNSTELASETMANSIKGHWILNNPLMGNG